MNWTFNIKQIFSRIEVGMGEKAELCMIKLRLCRQSPVQAYRWGQVKGWILAHLYYQDKASLNLTDSKTLAQATFWSVLYYGDII